MLNKFFIGFWKCGKVDVKEIKIKGLLDSGVSVSVLGKNCR